MTFARRWTLRWIVSERFAPAFPFSALIPDWGLLNYTPLICGLAFDASPKTQGAWTFDIALSGQPGAFEIRDGTYLELLATTALTRTAYFRPSCLRLHEFERLDAWCCLEAVEDNPEEVKIPVEYMTKQIFSRTHAIDGLTQETRYHY